VVVVVVLAFILANNRRDLIVEELEGAVPDRRVGELQQVREKGIYKLLGRLAGNHGRQVINGDNIEARSDSDGGVVKVSDLE